MTLVCTCRIQYNFSQFCDFSPKWESISSLLAKSATWFSCVLAINNSEKAQVQSHAKFSKLTLYLHFFPTWSTCNSSSICALSLWIARKWKVNLYYLKAHHDYSVYQKSEILSSYDDYSETETIKHNLSISKLFSESQCCIACFEHWPLNEMSEMRIEHEKVV